MKNYPPVRYSKLGQVALNVTDLSRARDFYIGMVGLEPAGDGPEGEALFRCTDDHHAVTLHRAPTPGVKRSSWQLEDERQFDNLYRRLDGAGIRWRDIPEEQS